MKHCRQIELCVNRTADCIPQATKCPWAILLIRPQTLDFPQHSGGNTRGVRRHQLAFCKVRGNKFPNAEDIAAFRQTPTKPSGKQSSDRITSRNAMRSAGGITNFRSRINSEAPEDGGGEVCRSDRIGFRIGSNTIT